MQGWQMENCQAQANALAGGCDCWLTAYGSVNVLAQTVIDKTSKP